MRDYKTEPLIFDGAPDCEHEWGADIIKKQSGGTNNNIGNNCDDRIHYESKTNFCSKCGAWKGQLGLEPTPELFIKHLLDFFDDVRMKLKDTGSMFINLGDTYSGSGNGYGSIDPKNKTLYESGARNKPIKNTLLPPKCLCMIPQRFAWGMIERGWILRNEIVWHKVNHMPESVTDRLTKAHEVVYHFVKQARYYYNLDAIRQPHIGNNKKGCARKITSTAKFGKTSAFNGDGMHEYHPLGANPGDVWSINTRPFSDAHFAVFPLELVRRPILAGCPPDGWVLDPFAGSGTVGEFCRHNNRSAMLFELNPEYKPLINERAKLNEPELSAYGAPAPSSACRNGATLPP